MDCDFSVEFTCEAREPPAESGRDEHVYDPELDDIRSLLMNICETLSEVGDAQFLVSGFGQSRWPVTVDTDLSVLLEQLPEVRKALRSGDTRFTLDFYEQGVERGLRFERRSDTLLVTCESWHATWKPSPAMATMSVRRLEAMLDALTKRFVRCARVACPHEVTHPWFVAWCDATTDGAET